MTTPRTAAMAAAEPTAVMAITDTLEDEEYLTRVVIHRVTENRIGQAVTAIEILSPDNKRDVELEKYRLKRL